MPNGEYVERLDGQLATVQEKIAGLKSKIKEKEAEIIQTQEELAAAVEDQENVSFALMSLLTCSILFFFSSIKVFNEASSLSNVEMKESGI